MGPRGEREFGRRNFMDVMSLFLTEPLLTVRWGQRELGTIDPSSLLVRDGRRPVILLGGRAWGAGDIDDDRRIVWVGPVDEPGRSRWASGGGVVLARRGRRRGPVAARDPGRRGHRRHPP